MREQEISKKQYQYILLILLIVIGLILFKQLQPYLGGFMGAITLYILLRGQMKALTEKKKMPRGLSATVILFEAFFIFLIPLTGLGFLVADTISGINIDPEIIKETVVNFVNNIEKRFNINLFTPDNLSFIPKLGTNFVQILALNTYSFVMNTVVILFVLYFMLYSYKDLEVTIGEILPFSSQNKHTFVREVKSIIQANALGIPLLAIIQGVFAYVGYLLLGVSNPVLYAVLTAFASIIPLVGTGLVYIPLAIVFLVEHKYGPAIGLALYGMIVIGSVDNIFRFLLQKKLADIHPLITVFGVIIGIPMFGFWGVIFGPLLLSIFILFFNMYRYDYIPESVAQPHVTKYKIRDYKEIKNIKFSTFRSKNPKKKEIKSDTESKDNKQE